MREIKLSEAADMMIRTHRMHKALIEGLVKDIGIHRTQHKILMRLASSGKLPSQKELAEHLDISPAAVTGALKKIERDGYVEISIGQDSRYNELKITEKGRALVELTRQKFYEADTSMFSGFTANELSTYVICLEKLQQNMRNQMGEGNLSARQGKENIGNEKMV